MAGHLILLYEREDAFSDLSPEQMQAIIQKYQQWGAKLREEGKLLDSRKLKEDGGRHLSRRGDEIVTDGPFSETREVIGGFFLIEADDYDEAERLCRDCPHLEFGRIEIRAIDDLKN